MHMLVCSVFKSVAAVTVAAFKTRVGRCVLVTIKKIYSLLTFLHLDYFISSMIQLMDNFFPTFSIENYTGAYGCYEIQDVDWLSALKCPPAPGRGTLNVNAGEWFFDEDGRRVILRGVNLGGSSKSPVGSASHTAEKFYDTKNLSFVGRPFPLHEADEHFARLSAWGLNFVRLVVTWEAVEHKGPGIYDEEYLDYLLQLVRKAQKYNISCLIDPHQVCCLSLLIFCHYAHSRAASQFCACTDIVHSGRLV